MGTTPRLLFRGVLAVAVRRPRKVALPESAYMDLDAFEIPASVVDLEMVPGRCFSHQDVVRCPQSASNVVCMNCAMVELGERWPDFKARTNAGVPKVKWYRDLDRAQAEPDPEFARQQRRSREYLARVRREQSQLP